MDNGQDSVDISTAAIRLGVTPQAVRKRITRGTLSATKRDGRWYVVLDGHDGKGNNMETAGESGGVLTRRISRRNAIKAGGIAALGLAFSKPLINTIRPPPAFAQVTGPPGETPPPATTLNLQVGSSSDDAEEIENGGAMNTTATLVTVVASLFQGLRHWGGIRFTGLSIPAGSTITACTVEIRSDTFITGHDDIRIDVHMEPTAAPSTFTTTSGDITGRSRTTASVSWSADNVADDTFIVSPDIKAVLQEVVDSFTPTTIVVILKPQQTQATSKIIDFKTYDNDPSLAAKLNITYTSP